MKLLLLVILIYQFVTLAIGLNGARALPTGITMPAADQVIDGSDSPWHLILRGHVLFNNK
jgi:hypothetical protein